MIHYNKIKYAAPDCAEQEWSLAMLLCNSPEAGETEEVNYEDWVI